MPNVSGGYSVCFESHGADAEFSPTEILGKTIPVVMRNLEAAGVEVGSTS